MKSTVKVIQREEELVIDGQTFSETGMVGQVVRATPTSGKSPEYIRLQYDDGRSWKWLAPLDDWSGSVEDDADSSGFDARWARE
jgi:hypothetical protein